MSADATTVVVPPPPRTPLARRLTDILLWGGLAAVLGTVLTPLAAILPFVDPGLAKDASCAALMADARYSGVPVRAVKAVPAHR